MQKVSIMWFRRDLRLHDNAALYHALKSRNPVLPVLFLIPIFSMTWKIKRQACGIYLCGARGNAGATECAGQYDERLVWKAIGSLPLHFNNLRGRAGFTNHDYEQYAIDRDEAVAALLKEHGASFHTYKDHVLLEKEEVLKDDSSPYTVFTPYSRKWKAVLNDFHLKPYPVENTLTISISSLKWKCLCCKAWGLKAQANLFRQKRHGKILCGSIRSGVIFRQCMAPAGWACIYALARSVFANWQAQPNHLVKLT